MPEGQAQAARAVLYNYFTYRGGILILLYVHQQ